MFLLATSLASPRSWKVFLEQSSSNLPQGCLTQECAPLCRDFPWPSMISILIYFRYVTQHVVWFRIGKLQMHCAFAVIIKGIDAHSHLKDQSSPHSRQWTSQMVTTFRWNFFRPSGNSGLLITILQAQTVWWMTTPFLIWEEDSTTHGAGSKLIEGEAGGTSPSETIIRRKATRFFQLLQSWLHKAWAAWGIVTSVDASHFTFILIEASRSNRFLDIFRRTDP